MTKSIKEKPNFKEIAASFYLSSDPERPIDMQLIDLQEGETGNVLLWEPFQHFEYDRILELIFTLSDTLEKMWELGKSENK